MPLASNSRADGLDHGLGLGGLTAADQVLECAVAPDEAGYERVFHMNHLIDDAASSPDEHHPFYDPWITPAGVAARTERLPLGARSTPIPRRESLPLARTLATLDQLSDGRVPLGA